jgi:hypothetical protein
MSARRTKLPPSGPVGVFVPLVELHAVMALLKDGRAATAVQMIAAMFSRPKRLPLRGEVRE